MAVLLSDGVLEINFIVCTSSWKTCCKHQYLEYVNGLLQQFVSLNLSGFIWKLKIQYDKQ